jgi:GNAT superfamily N-acetyltransferase
VGMAYERKTECEEKPLKEYQVIERKPTVEEFFELRQSVGWGIGEKDDYKKGIENSLFGVCAILNEEIIGTARVIGDGRTCFYIQDVIVKPEYQRMGIGLALMKETMNFIEENACFGAIVGLMSAKGKESFYEKFGFWIRPTEKFGHGMMQFWKKPQ